jgi:RHS repeat-associated protein
VFGGDGLVGRTGAANIYYVFDQQGNVAQRLNSSQSVTSSSTYDAYGAETTTGSPSDPFGYNGLDGYYLDRDTAVYLATNRYYDPALGRWLVRDPIASYGGVNNYCYCAGDPETNDPSGLGGWSNLARYLMNGGYGPVNPQQCAKLKRQLDEAERKLAKWRNRGWDQSGRDPGGKAISPRKGGGVTKPDGHLIKYRNAEKGVEKMRDVVRRFCPDDDPPPCPIPVPNYDPVSEGDPEAFWRGDNPWAWVAGAGIVVVAGGVIVLSGGSAGALAPALSL